MKYIQILFQLCGVIDMCNRLKQKEYIRSDEEELKDLNFIYEKGFGTIQVERLNLNEPNC